ncbi:hypothetical protein [Streptomyces sp. MN13]
MIYWSMVSLYEAIRAGLDRPGVSVTPGTDRQIKGLPALPA